jgi:hypothetical protein
MERWRVVVRRAVQGSEPSVNAEFSNARNCPGYMYGIVVTYEPYRK